MDTIRLDVFALDLLTFPVQPELSVAMDWYSRCITGLRVTPGPAPRAGHLRHSRRLCIGTSE
jgi:hypothetical protein